MLLPYSMSIGYISYDILIHMYVCMLFTRQVRTRKLLPEVLTVRTEDVESSPCRQELILLLLEQFNS